MDNTALLIMDVQQGVVARNAEGSESLLAAAGRAAAAARAAGLSVVFVRVAFRANTPEVSGRNRTFSALAGSSGMGIDDSATQIHPAVAPQVRDIVVVKKRISAFAGSDLDIVLRSLGVTSLVLSGIATSGVVLSTLRQAADLDYETTVLRDACSDADAEVHRVLMDKVFSMQATVLDTDEWIGNLAANQPNGLLGPLRRVEVER